MVNPQERKKELNVATPEAIEVEATVEYGESIKQESGESERDQERLSVNVENELPTRSSIAPQDKTSPEKSKLLTGIEVILAQDLGDAYLAMNEQKRIAFKKRGEEIAQKVQQMAQKGRFHVRKVLRWIRDWLRMIPGVNNFFLEQEAKIKADQLLEYYHDQTGK